MPDAVAVARRLHLTGLVQGVGFRPFVHRLALTHEVTGWVRNASGAVEIHVEGPADVLDRFADALRREAPVLARIESLRFEEAAITGHTAFEVRPSAISLDERLPVAPDVAMCEACARELSDPANRRFRYPFITCTDCGPRFTVIASMPYDRERTSMRAFRQCAACSQEYTQPGDRRYHSETNSCPACGPTLWFTRGDATAIPDVGEHALAAAAKLLQRGGVLALRGLGGFHLATDATNEDAVARLRLLKHREAKPLAVMVRTLDEARALAHVTDAEAVELTSRARPIVLLPPRRSSGATAAAPTIATNVAPGVGLLGVMLAYTPLHHLLLEAAATPLVMTSGNVSEEPIAIGNDEALARLRGIADGFLLHDREIVARYDDSVVRVVDGAPLFVRRARGYAPDPIDLPVATPRPLLAVGPHLKNTFTLLHENRAYVSQHIGDLENLETLDHFRRAAERMEQLFHVRPECVVHDLHPGYLSTRLALESGLDVLPPVQHHHAHVAAVLAEHGRCDHVIGVAYDGTGYGDDGTVWGSEILYADLQGYQRLGHLRPAPLPGGDAAARAPWRVAMGYSTLAAEPSAYGSAWEGVSRQALEVVQRQLERGLNSPMASSMGRLFDAAAAVIGVRRIAAFEGQAAMELEALAGEELGEVLPFQLTEARGSWQLDPSPLLAALGRESQRGVFAATLAASFHDTLVAATDVLVRRVAESTGCRTVVLAGGCFQNARLLSALTATLRDGGFEVLLPRRLSPNDGAISVGQAAVAAARLSLRS